MALPASATAYWEEQRRVSALSLAIAKRLWLRMGNDFDASWDQIAPTLVASVEKAQADAGALAADFVPAVLDDLNVDAPAVDEVLPESLVGVTGGGVPLEQGMYSAVVTSKQAVGRGATMVDALSAGADVLQMMIATTLSDTGRAAESLGIATRPGVGYIRMLEGQSCSRCIILAGRFYRWSAGFKRHPRCFPAGTVVSGPKSEAATRRWYEGELVILTTTSGEKLSVTGNHPILTRRGWVPANLLREGDDVVRSTRSEGASALEVPDHDQAPSLIEDVWSSMNMDTLSRVETTPEDFHGDGQHGEVDIVHADGSLRDRIKPAFAEQFSEPLLTGGVMDASLFGGEGTAELVDLRVLDGSGNSVRRGSLGFPLGAGHLGGAVQSGFASAASGGSVLLQSFANDIAGYSVLPSEGVFAGTSEICGNDGVDGKDFVSSRWDAPLGSFFMDSAGEYASRGLDLLHRLSGQVEFDRLVEARSVDFKGHVYSLTSSEGWHTANSLIVSNCDCRHLPATQQNTSDLAIDPGAYFRSLPQAEQDARFGAAGAQAIRDGADMSQVVNADKGMRQAQVYGQNLRITTEGVTKRGVAGKIIRARGRDPVTTPRLMPSTIYDIAEDRADALRLLRLNGYIVNREGVPLSGAGSRTGLVDLREVINLDRVAVPPATPRSLTEDAGRALGSSTWRGYADNVPAADASLARIYTGNGYEDINAALREGDLVSLSRTKRDTVTALDRIIEEAPRVPESVTVSRAVEANVFGLTGDADLMSVVGKPFTDDAFMSTAFQSRLSRLDRHEVEIRLDVPAGSKGVYVSSHDVGDDRSLAAFGPDENELILARATRYEFADAFVEDGRRVLVGRVVGQGGSRG